jgi:hypothetical protein
MKRLLLSAVLWGAVLLPLAAHAQRVMGGGRVGAPARVSPGFVSRPMSPGFVSRPAPAARFAGPAVRTVSPQGHVLIGQRPFFPPNRVAFHHFRHFHHFHNRPFFFANGCFGPGFVDPFFCGGFASSAFLYAPYYPFDSSYSYPPPEPQPVVVQDDSNTRELSYQVERLSDEVAAMREEAQKRDEPQVTNIQPTVKEPLATTILVFKDGHQMTIHNYAIAGSTLWVLNEHTAKKVLISDLNVPATEQANSKNGVEFRIPQQ